MGLLAGILIVGPKVSPLAAGLPGLALLAWTGLYLASAQRAVYYVPLKSRVYGAGFEALLFDGVLALAGLVMIIPLFVPSRWRLRAAAAPSPYGAVPDAYPDLGATQTTVGAAGCRRTGPRPRRSRGWIPARRRHPGAPRNLGAIRRRRATADRDRDSPALTQPHRQVRGLQRPGHHAGQVGLDRIQVHRVL